MYLRHFVRNYIAKEFNSVVCYKKQLGRYFYGRLQARDGTHDAKWMTVVKGGAIRVIKMVATNIDFDGNGH